MMARILPKSKNKMGTLAQQQRENKQNMVSINTNAMNLIVQKNLSSANLGLATAMERMSTGYRINSAKDDAAGYAVASGIMSQVRGLSQAQKNTQDGLSLLNLAGSSVSNMSKIAQRIKELSIQAANGTYGIEARKAMQAEADELVKQLYQIKNTTSFNGINILGKEAQFFTSSPFSGANGATTFNANGTPTFNATSAATFAGMEATAKLATSFNIKGATESTPKEETPVSDDPLLARSAAPSGSMKLTRASSNTITGSIDLAGSGAEKTKKVNIDGVDYTFINGLETKQQVSYSKDKDTGELSIFTGSNISIVGQKDKAHNVVLTGRYVTFNGGDLADTIQVGALSAGFSIHGGDGNDIIKSEFGSNGTIDAGTGDDEVTVTYASTVYGGAGNDTLKAIWTIGYYAGANVLRGDDGDDILIASYNYNMLFGGAGEDTLSVTSGTDNILDGGAGTNKLEKDGGVNTITANVPGANSFVENFLGKETKTLSIDGKSYTIYNGIGAQSLIYRVNAGVVEFMQGNNFTITAQANVKHNVKMGLTYSNFIGGDLDDEILVKKDHNTIRGGKGNDNITADSYTLTIYGEDGDDTITNNSSYNKIYGGNGNDRIVLNANGNAGGRYDGEAGDDTIYVNSNNLTAIGGDGNDTFILKKGIKDLALIGGIGVNNIIDNGAININKSGFGADDNGFEVKFAGQNEVQEIEINGIKYSVKNREADANSFFYSLNSVTGQITFSGYNFTVDGQKDKQHNVLVLGSYIDFTGGDLDDTMKSLISYNKLYGGAGDDIIDCSGNGCYAYGGEGNDTMFGNANKYGEAGDDIIYANGAINAGGEGNDTYYIDNRETVIKDESGNNIFYVNSSNNSITAGDGSDSFYITGSNNYVVQGGAGNDFFSIDGSSNNIIGGTGENYFVVNGDSNTIQGGPDNKDLIVDNGTGNIKNNVQTDTSSGVLNFSSIGQERTFSIGGKTYTVKNQNAGGTSPASNSLKYFFNQNTGELTLEGSFLTVTAENDKTHNIVVKGSENVINGGNLGDKIVVSTGTNNTLNGNDGDDIIVTNTENNKILGGNGNDSITVNASNGANIIDGGSGNDALTINSSGNSNILGGIGNDRIVANGSNNILNSGGGDDNVLTIGDLNTINDTSGNNVLNAQGDNNKVTGGSGSDTIGVNGKNNTVTAGDGNNTLNIVGESNTATSGNGNDSINVLGSNNQASSISGENSFIVRGNSNKIEGGRNEDKISLSGNSNIANGNDGDDSFNVSYIADGNTVNGGLGYNTLINKGENTILINVRDITPDSTDIRLQVGSDGSADSCIIFTSSFDLGDLIIDFSTEEKALESMQAIDDVISNLVSKNAEYGAISNRLNSAIEMQSVSINNLIAAHSSIMDADIAVESANFVKNQILEQASASLLSQTKNIQASLILGLLPTKSNR